MSATQSVKHHINPRHLLARFENDAGGLTVVRRRPWVVLRDQSPESVGYIKRHNSRRNPDGTWDDQGEQILANMDAVGAAELDEAIRFAIDAEAHLRLLDISLDHRANLQLFIATMMVRTPSFRDRFDESALPTLIEHMRARLEEQFTAGEIDAQTHKALTTAFDTPDHVQLKRPENRHVDVMVPLIAKVATRLHLDTLVGVRRFAEPLLLTSGEPVVVFPNADVSQGRSAGEFLFATGESPIQSWQEMDTLLDQVDARLRTLAALAIAIDPHTVLMMFNADTDDGGKSAFITSQVPAEGLAGVINILATGSSEWVAGREDCEFLSLIVKSAHEHAPHAGAADRHRD
jgi:hypothetical protein